MPAEIYYDQDAHFSPLKGKTIAIIGHGSQGHAQARTARLGMRRRGRTEARFGQPRDGHSRRVHARLRR